MQLPYIFMFHQLVCLQWTFWTGFRFRKGKSMILLVSALCVHFTLWLQNFQAFDKNNILTTLLRFEILRFQILKFKMLKLQTKKFLQQEVLTVALNFKEIENGTESVSNKKKINKKTRRDFYWRVFERELQKEASSSTISSFFWLKVCLKSFIRNSNIAIRVRRFLHW